jgi:hypothetical protein
MKAASSPKRSHTAGAKTLQAPAAPPLDDLQALRKRVEYLEEQLAILKGDRKDSAEEWLYSAESIAEYKHAIRRFHFFKDRLPLDRYCEKTGGKVPHLHAGKPASRQEKRRAS